MENQINVGDQNTQQIGQNPINQPSQVPEKLKTNYWKILTIIFFLLLLGASAQYTLSTNKLKSLNIPYKKTVASSSVELFKYIKKVEDSKLQNTQIEAWKIEVNTNLLTDKNTKKFRINLFDGHNYEVERNEEQMQNSICNNQRCTWKGYISERSCMVKNTTTGKCSPGETIIFVLNENIIAGTIPAVVGVNQYAYSVGEIINEPGVVLFKIDSAKFRLD